MGKTIVNDIPDYSQAPPKRLCLKNIQGSQKNVVLSSLDQSLSCPICRLQVWLMTMRMLCEWKGLNDVYKYKGVLIFVLLYTILFVF